MGWGTHHAPCRLPPRRGQHGLLLLSAHLRILLRRCAAGLGPLARNAASCLRGSSGSAAMRSRFAPLCAQMCTLVYLHVRASNSRTGAAAEFPAQSDAFGAAVGALRLALSLPLRLAFGLPPQQPPADVLVSCRRLHSFLLAVCGYLLPAGAHVRVGVGRRGSMAPGMGCEVPHSFLMAARGYLPAGRCVSSSQLPHHPCASCLHHTCTRAAPPSVRALACLRPAAAVHLC